MRTAGLLLAAGAGRRLGMPKALVRLGDETLLTRGLRTLTDGGCDPALAVLGAQAGHIRDVHALSPSEVVVVPGWAEGIGASLRTALTGLPGTVDAVVVTLVDQPWLTAEAVRRVRACADHDTPAAVAAYGDRHGHPILLRRDIWDEVAASAVGDVGARSWLRRNASRVTAVPCEDTGHPTDIDTAAGLRRARLEIRR